MLNQPPRHCEKCGSAIDVRENSFSIFDFRSGKETLHEITLCKDCEKPVAVFLEGYLSRKY